jgi:hypothetical protein
MWVSSILRDKNIKSKLEIHSVYTKNTNYFFQSFLAQMLSVFDILNVENNEMKNYNT